jgi:predicted Fe-Mo cluster-binding NifX family protein
MRIAIPIWNSRVSPVFDTARTVLLCEVADGQPGERSTRSLPAGAPQRAEFLTRAGVDVLVCGAISRPLADLVTDGGIRLIPFVAGEVEEVLQAFSRNRLPDSAFLMPGCRRRHGYRHGRAGRRRARRAGRTTSPEEQET